MKVLKTELTFLAKFLHLLGPALDELLQHLGKGRLLARLPILDDEIHDGILELQIQFRDPERFLLGLNLLAVGDVQLTDQVV